MWRMMRWQAVCSTVGVPPVELDRQPRMGLGTVRGHRLLDRKEHLLGSATLVKRGVVLRACPRGHPVRRVS